MSDTSASCIADLVEKLAEYNAFRVRQRSAHALAALLAHEDTPALVASLGELRERSHVYAHLVALGTEAMEKQPAASRVVTVRWPLAWGRVA